MKRRHAPLLTVAVVALVAIGLAACGGSSNDSSSGDATTASAASGSDSVSTQSISGAGTVLVDSSGQALYTNNQDSGMNVACTGSCAAIWIPLMAPSGGQPSSSDQAVQAKLGVVKTNRHACLHLRPGWLRSGDGQWGHRQLRWHELHLDGGEHGPRPGELEQHEHLQRRRQLERLERRLRLLARR